MTRIEFCTCGGPQNNFYILTRVYVEWDCFIFCVVFDHIQHKMVISNACYEYEIIIYLQYVLLFSYHASTYQLSLVAYLLDTFLGLGYRLFYRTIAGFFIYDRYSLLQKTLKHYCLNWYQKFKRVNKSKLLHNHFVSPFGSVWTEIIDSIFLLMIFSTFFIHLKTKSWKSKKIFCNFLQWKLTFKFKWL